MISVRNRLTVLLLAFLASVGLVSTVPVWVLPAQAATEVTIYAGCQTGLDRFSFNATYQGIANRSYNVYYQYRQTTATGGGGTFDWQPMGKVTTGSQGLGSTNTVYISLGAGKNTINIRVKINGVVAEKNLTCYN